MFFVVINTFDDLCICIPQLAAQNRCLSVFWLFRQAKQFFYLPCDDFSSPVVVFKLPAIVQIQEAGNETFAVFVIPHVREFRLIPHKRLVLNTFQQRIQNVLRIIRLLARMLFDQLPQIHNVFEVINAFPRTDQSDARAAFDPPFARIVVRRVAQRRIEIVERTSVKASQGPVEHAVRAATNLEKSCDITACDRTIAFHITVVEHRQPAFFLQFRHDFRRSDATVIVPNIRQRPRHVVEIGVARPVLLRAKAGHLLQRFQQTDILVHRSLAAPCGLVDRLHDQFRPAARLHFLQHGPPEGLMSRKEFLLRDFQPLSQGKRHAWIRQQNDRAWVPMPLVGLHRRHKRVALLPFQRGLPVLIAAQNDIRLDAQPQRRHAQAAHIGQIAVDQRDIARMGIVFTEELRPFVRQGKTAHADFHGKRLLHAVQIQYRHTFIYARPRIFRHGDIQPEGTGRPLLDFQRPLSVQYHRDIRIIGFHLIGRPLVHATDRPDGERVGWNRPAVRAFQVFRKRNRDRLQVLQRMDGKRHRLRLARTGRRVQHDIRRIFTGRLHVRKHMLHPMGTEQLRPHGPLLLRRVAAIPHGTVGVCLERSHLVA